MEDTGGAARRHGKPNAATLANNSSRSCETMTKSRSKWTIVGILKDEFILIRDIGTDCISVTNDAENVVWDILHDQRVSCRIFYFDSQGDLDELVHDGKKFVRFAPLSNVDEYSVNLHLEMMKLLAEAARVGM